MEATTVAGNLSGNSTDHCSLGLCIREDHIGLRTPESGETDKSVKSLPQLYNRNAALMKTILLLPCRYSYEQQPAICKWNIRKLGEMFALICPQSALDPVVEEWDAVYRSVQVTTKCL